MARTTLTRSAALLLALLLLLSLCACGQTTGDSERIDQVLQEKRTVVEGNEPFDIFATIGASYLVWADLFGVPNVDTEPTYSAMQNNPDEKIMYLDDLAIVYDENTFDTIWVALFYIDDTVPETEMNGQVLRLASLYAAVEKGNPSNYSEDDINETQEAAKDFHAALTKVLNEKEESLMAGDVIPFYSSRVGAYYVSLSEQALLIYVR